MDIQYTIILSIVIGLIAFPPASRLFLNACCDILIWFKQLIVAEDKPEDSEHPRRRTRTMQKGYREPTWPAPDVEFETPEANT